MSQEDNLRKLYEKLSRRQLCDAMRLTLDEIKRISEKFSMQLIEQAKKTSDSDTYNVWKDPYITPEKDKPMSNLFHKTNLFQQALDKLAAEEPKELPKDPIAPFVHIHSILPEEDLPEEEDKKDMPAKPKKPKKPAKPGGPGRKLYPKKPGKTKPNRRPNKAETWQVMSRPHSDPDQLTVIAEFDDYSDASQELGRQLKKHCPSVLEQRFVTGAQQWKVPTLFLWMQKKDDA